MELIDLYEKRREIELRIKPLKEQLKAVELEIDRLEKRPPKDSVLAAIKAAASKSGWTLAELFTIKTKVKGHAVYRHPKRPELTWTGRGRQPGWIKEAEREGLCLLDLHVVEQADRAGRQALKRASVVAGRS